MIKHPKSVLTRQADDPGTGPEARSGIAKLEARTGALQKVATRFAISAESGNALRAIHRESIGAERRIASTAIAIRETEIQTAMVTRAVPRLMGLVDQLHAAHNAANQAASESEAGAVYSHLSARHRRRSEFTALAASTGLTDDEIAACLSWIDANAADDVELARDATIRTKEVNLAFAKRALEGALAARLPHE